MWVVFLLLLTGSILFLSLVFVYLRLELLKQTVKNRPCLFKLLSCGRIKDREAFMNFHKVNVLRPNEVPLSELVNASTTNV